MKHDTKRHKDILTKRKIRKQKAKEFAKSGGAKKLKEFIEENPEKAL